jgi:hypothetical protein
MGDLVKLEVRNSNIERSEIPIRRERTRARRDRSNSNVQKGEAVRGVGGFFSLTIGGDADQWRAHFMTSIVVYCVCAK